MHNISDRIRAQNAVMAACSLALGILLYVLVAAVPAYITGDSRCMFVRCTIEVEK